MNSSTNNSISRFIVFAALSSSVLPLEMDDSTSMSSETNIGHAIQQNEPIDLDDEVFNVSSSYKLRDYSANRIDSIIYFSKNVINNSKDIDGEFVNLVNENFWDLV